MTSPISVRTETNLDVVMSLGRIQIIQGTPPCLPGKCVVCGTSECLEGFIDFGFELDFYGVVYFCFNCIREAAGVVGFIPVDSLQSVVIVTNELTDTVQKLQEENQELKNALGSLGRLGFSSDSDSGDSVASSETFSEEPAESAKPEPEFSLGSTEGEHRSSQPDDESRFTSLRDDESDKRIFNI